MAVRLSYLPGGFCVVLREPAWLEPALMADELARILRVPRPDSVRICRLQRGILFEGATREQAETVRELLQSQGIAAVVAPDASLPQLPKPLHVAVAEIRPDGLSTPSVVGAGMPKSWPWDALAMMCGGIIVGPEVQSPALLDSLGEQALSEQDDRRSIAARALERARQRVFPLREEISRPEAEIAEALQAAVAGSALPATPVPGFGQVQAVIDLIFTRPLERLRIEGTSRILGLRRSSSRARDLHVAVSELARHAESATLPGATLALADGADAGDYVFEDLKQFDAYCRWAYFWRLQQA